MQPSTSMSTSPAPKPAPQPAPVTLRLATLNIHKGFGPFNRRFTLPALRSAIRTLGAEVMCLQEVLGEHRRHARRHEAWPAMPQYEFLAESLWHQHAYGRNAIYADGHHGNAVLSKYPIRRHFNHDLSIAGPERRGLLHCTIDIIGQAEPLHVLCAHLSLLESHRQRQLDLICALLASEISPTAPVVLAGDFNDWRGRADKPLEGRAGLREVFRTAEGQSRRSFPARLPTLRLDRIYTRNIRAAIPLDIDFTPWSRLSDHLPLAADITL